MCGACAHASESPTADETWREDLPKEIKAIFGVDIDAVGGWLGSYGGEDSPSDIQPRHVRG
jgi:hypothetical protein